MTAQFEPLQNDLLLRAARRRFSFPLLIIQPVSKVTLEAGQKVDRAPMWVMRQGNR